MVGSAVALNSQQVPFCARVLDAEVDAKSTYTNLWNDFQALIAEGIRNRFFEAGVVLATGRGDFAKKSNWALVCEFQILAEQMHSTRLRAACVQLVRVTRRGS